MEKLTVDMGADLAGWAGRREEDKVYQMEKEMAHRRSTDVEEEMKDLKKAQEELVFENNQLTEKLSKYEAAISELKEGLQDTNLSNARLLYTNRVLRNTSLNERQKDKIVEAISDAGSVTEAKTIYDTLQSTVEAKPKRSPQSLSEAISRRSTVIRATREESTSSDPFQDRMKRLAGIK
jgi:predicted nuclease with TOPRIM domain